MSSSDGLELNIVEIRLHSGYKTYVSCPETSGIFVIPVRGYAPLIVNIMIYDIIYIPSQHVIYFCRFLFSSGGI